MKAAIYVRVSRADLNLENQVRPLRARAEREGWEYTIFEEQETTRKTRPIKDALLARLVNGDFDVLMCARFDRWARSLSEIVYDVERMMNAGVIVIFASNSMEFSKLTATSRLQLQIFGAFAEFEREMIRERTLDGLARARAQGKVLGRPRKYPPVIAPASHVEAG